MKRFSLSRLLAVSVSIILTFSTIKHACAQTAPTASEMAADFADIEKRADELLDYLQSFVQELLQNARARQTLSVFLKSSRSILQSTIATDMLTSITLQMKDTLADAKAGAPSIKYIADGLRDLLTNEVTSETFEALLESFEHAMLNPELPIVADQAFDLVIAFSQMGRGPDLVSSIKDGVLSLVKRENNKEYVVRGFKNIKQIMVSGMRGHVKNFITG